MHWRAPYFIFYLLACFTRLYFQAVDAQHRKTAAALGDLHQQQKTAKSALAKSKVEQQRIKTASAGERLRHKMFKQKHRMLQRQMESDFASREQVLRREIDVSNISRRPPEAA